MDALQSTIHSCKLCHDVNPSIPPQYPPVVSFGPLDAKPIVVVGINPSIAEYVGKNGGKPYLSRSNDVNERSRKQLDYFKNEPYDFFKQIELFFQDTVREKVVRWHESPWEKVGYLDLVKCVTLPAKGGQWGGVSDSEQQRIISLCQPYLKEQLEKYMPKLVIAYGADVCRWFRRDSSKNPEKHTPSKIAHGVGCLSIADDSSKCERAVCFLYQRQGELTPPQVDQVRAALIDAFGLLKCPPL